MPAANGELWNEVRTELQGGVPFDERFEILRPSDALLESARQDRLSEPQRTKARAEYSWGDVCRQEPLSECSSRGHLQLPGQKTHRKHSIPSTELGAGWAHPSAFVPLLSWMGQIIRLPGRYPPA
jgi:hypothetical protein